MHSTLPLALLALAPLAASKPFTGHVPHPAPGPRDLAAARGFSRHVRHSPGTLRSLRRRANAPTNLAEGSLSAAEGCAAWVRPVSGDSCYSLIAEVGLDLDAFRALNEQIDDECHNLWAGYDYCIKKTTSSSGKAAASSTTTTSVKAKATASVAKAVHVKVASTTTSAPAASATASDDEDEDDEEGECEADDGADDEDEDDDEEVSTSAASTKSHTQSAAYSSQPTTTTTTAAPQTTTTASAAAKSTTSTSARAASSSSSKTLLAAVGVTSFLGTNTGIGSWYNADSSSDSTNGRSWCEFQYNDDSPVFAPSVGTMRKNFGYDNEAAATAYCGLEAIVTTPDGKSKTMYLGDGFDDAWVLSPGSIDIMHNAFNFLFSSSTNNKNDVIKGIT